MPSEIEHWRGVQKILRGYRAAQVMISCTQFGVFRHLAEQSQTASQLAGKTNTAPPALRRLLDAAVAIGLLTKEGEIYANTPLSATCLAQEGPFHLGHLVRREGAFYQRWGYLTEAVRTGQRPETNVKDEGQTNWVHDFELALFDLARAVGPAVAEALALPIDRPLRVLDVGGGHGGYSMALARRYPNVRPTVFELPAAAEVAREIIAGEEMSERVSVQVGDFQKEGLGSGFDVVLLFGVLVSETQTGKLALLRKTYKALVPGGLAVIRGFGLSDDRISPPEAALASLHMLLSTEAGDLFTLSEIQRWLAEVGFIQAHQVPLPDWIGSTLLLAHKPNLAS